MAPRGRHRKKVGQTRMDAAIDALSPMGFLKSSIRRKVNALLKVYDGEWQFIEESSYRVLIEAMIEEQEEMQVAIREEQDEEHGAIIEDQNMKEIEDGGYAFGRALPSNTHDDDAEPSGALTAKPSSTGTTQMLTYTSTKREPAKHARGRDDYSVPQSGGRMEWKDISCMDHDRPQDMAIATTNNNEDGPDNGLGEIDLQSAARPPTRRKPCYGWISSGFSDDEEEFVYFKTEASQRKEMKQSEGCQKIRKCRWDVKELR